MPKIAIFINTPAQLHFYRNIAKNLVRNGNEVVMLFRDYGETIMLAKEMGLVPIVYSLNAKDAVRKLLFLPKDVINAVKKLKTSSPDLITGFEIYGAYTSAFLRSRYIAFYDSEPRSHKLLALQYNLFMPLTDVMITPSSFLDDLGSKHIRVNSYKELAYLHPNYFQPSNDIFDLLGISRNEDYVVLRFNAFDAVHDLQVSGFNSEQKVKLVEALSRYAHVFVSAEGSVPKKIEKNVLKIPKRKIHDLLYYAKLFVTDTQTMATEAAILGTPTIRSNNFVDAKREMGNFLELEKKYGLMFSMHDRNKAISLAEELIKDDALKKEWARRREVLLKDKVDISSFMTWFIENFPESCKEMKSDPAIQFRFR